MRSATLALWSSDGALNVLAYFFGLVVAAAVVLLVLVVLSIAILLRQGGKPRGRGRFALGAIDVLVGGGGLLSTIGARTSGLVAFTEVMCFAVLALGCLLLVDFFRSDTTDKS
jgi:hypothetical protein